MPITVRLRRPVAPGDMQMTDDGQPALVLRLTPTEPADEYDATVTTARASVHPLRRVQR